MSKYGEHEIYTRFLRRDWIKTNPKIKISPKAFEPRFSETKNRQELSCYETQNLEIDGIKDIFIRENISLNHKPPCGHCSIFASEFIFDYLSVDQNYDRERHIDIIGWENIPNKAILREIQTKLAELGLSHLVTYD